MIRILIVDALSEVRYGLRMLLAVQPDMAVVGETGNALDALTLAKALSPDVILADIGMQAAGGPEMIACLRAAAPSAILVVLTLHGDQDARARAQEAGALTLLEKYEGAPELLLTLREIARNRSGDCGHAG